MFGNFYPALVYSLSSFAGAVSYNTVVTSPSSSTTSQAANDLLWVVNGN